MTTRESNSNVTTDMPYEDELLISLRSSTPLSRCSSLRVTRFSMSSGLVPAYGAITMTKGIFTSGDDSRGSPR